MKVFLTYQDINDSQRIKAFSEGVQIFAGFQQYRNFMKATRITPPPSDFLHDIKNMAIYLGNPQKNSYKKYTEIIIEEVKKSHPHIEIIIYACDCEFKEKVALAEELKVGIQKCQCGGSDILPRLTC